VKAVIELASLSNFTARTRVSRATDFQQSASYSTALKPRCRPKDCLSSRSNSPPSCKRNRESFNKPTSQLGLKAQQLAEQNAEVERKNQEIEQARRALEEKAKELALTSKYKSEFLANMSHELRTR